MLESVSIFLSETVGLQRKA